MDPAHGHSQGDKRPAYRHAEVIDEAEFVRALSSGDPDTMNLALVDASRCLDAGIVFPRAFPLLQHPEVDVRLGALFALEQVLGDLGDEAWDPRLWSVLSTLALTDPEELVRFRASEQLAYSLSLAMQRVEDIAKKSPSPKQAHLAVKTMQDTIELLRAALTMMKRA